MGIQMHMRRIEPHEKWFSIFMLPLDKIFGCRNKFIITGFHPFFGHLGISVGSAFSVAQEWITPRGPKVSKNLGNSTFEG